MSADLRGISLWQPWASLVAAGEKRVETRSWTTAYRGPVAILASKRLPAAALAAMDEPEFRDALGRAGFHPRPPRAIGEDVAGRLPRGCVVAVATLADVQPTERLVVGGARTRMLELGWDLGEHEVALGDYSLGRYAWRLTDIRPLRTPVPAVGRQGLWRLPAAVAARALAQVGGPR